MSKKYLSLEEAAAQIGVSTAEVNRLREKGTLRAFADRGTWKFKEEDVEKLARSRQADSDPDVPLQSFDSPKDDSVSELVFGDEALENDPTLVRKEGDTGSDSDVRLIFDDSMTVPAASKGVPPEEDSDSDVKLAGGAPGVPEGGSDSDVKLVTDDEPTEATGSDSDVRLVSSDSSGEVQLAGPGSLKDGSTINLDPSGEGSSLGSSVVGEDSGISLAEGSGIALASDSGISLERPNDSGISLSEDSVTAESGISLAQEDSGISLSSDAPVMKGKGKQPKSAADSDDLTGTIPLMDIPAADSEDILDTQMEVPMVGDSSGDVKTGGAGTTSVITLDDDEDYSVTGGKKGAAVADEDVFAGDEAVVDVADEIVGEDDELGEDVFGAEDEDFGEVESGVSSADLPAGAPRMAAISEQEWGAGTFAGLAISALLMIACGTLMFDLVRNMWHVDVGKQNVNAISSMLLDAFKG